MTTRKSEFERIADEAKSLHRDAQDTDWALVALNLVLFPFVLGPAVSVADNTKSKEQPMPDEWLQVVSTLKPISKRGLKLLSDALATKGYVSVHDAYSFVEIEQRCAADTEARLKDHTEAASQVTGAAMLLARAERDLPGTIDRYYEDTKDLIAAASGAAAFAAEKAIWIGKGLGGLAQSLEKFRK